MEEQLHGKNSRCSIIRRLNLSLIHIYGEYTATVEGLEGQMTVKTTIADGKISAVEIVEQHETAGVADKAISDLPAAIVAENSVNVDTISGCTLSSGRILDAVTDCLNQASAQ